MAKTAKKSASKSAAKPASKSAAKSTSKSAAKPASKSAKSSSKTIEDLFLHGLKDTLYAEKKVLKALPKLAKGAKSPDLKAAFEKHVRETEGQVERLNRVFGLLGKKPQAKNCPAMDGLAEEGEEVLKEFKGAPALDAGLVGAAQSVEHYEIARYGTLKAWAEQMGMREAVRLLDQTLQEEIKTDQALTALAEGMVNQKARQAA